MPSSTFPSTSARAPRFLALAFSLIALVPAATAQFLQSGPPCAQQCPTLQQAQSLCIPPVAPQVQKTCFCQSALLTQLPASAAAVCPQCPATDAASVQQWFSGYCSDPNSPVGGAATSSAAPAETSTAAAAPGAQSSGTTVNGQSVDTVSGPDNRSWWEKHSKWIAMVIVLIIAFAAIIAASIWFKKRHDKRVNRATQTPLPVGWGPNSDPHTYANSATNSGAALVGTAPTRPPQDEEKGHHTAASTVGVSPNVGRASEQQKRGKGEAAAATIPGAKKLKKLVGR